MTLKATSLTLCEVTFVWQSENVGCCESTLNGTGSTSGSGSVFG